LADDVVEREQNLPEEKTETYFSEHKAPKGDYAETIPEDVFDVQEAGEALEPKILSKVNTVESLVQDSAVRMQKLNELQAKLQEAMNATGIPAEIEQLMQQELMSKDKINKLVYDVFNYIASLGEIEKDQYYVLLRLKDKFIAIDRYIRSVKNKKFTQEKLAYIEKLLDKDPEKYEKLKKQMAAFDAKFRNVEELINFYASWPISTTRIKKSQSWLDTIASWWNKFTQSAADLWKSIQDYANSWMNELQPQFDAQAQEIDTFLESEQQELEGQEALEATTAALSFARRRR
jgi:hypothetical protein